AVLPIGRRAGAVFGDGGEGGVDDRGAAFIARRRVRSRTPGLGGIRPSLSFHVASRYRRSGPDRRRWGLSHRPVWDTLYPLFPVTNTVPGPLNGRTPDDHLPVVLDERGPRRAARARARLLREGSRAQRRQVHRAAPRRPRPVEQGR